MPLGSQEANQNVDPKTQAVDELVALTARLNVAYEKVGAPTAQPADHREVLDAFNALIAACETLNDAPPDTGLALARTAYSMPSKGIATWPTRQALERTLGVIRSDEPMRPYIELHLAILMVELGEWNGAGTKIERALAEGSAPQTEWAILSGQYSLRIGRPDDAIRRASETLTRIEVIEAKPPADEATSTSFDSELAIQRISLLVILAHAYYDQGLIDRAIAPLEQASDLARRVGTDSLILQIDLEKITIKLLGTQRFADAANEATKLLQNDQVNAEHWAYGLLLQKRGRARIELARNADDGATITIARQALDDLETSSRQNLGLLDALDAALSSAEAAALAGLDDKRRSALEHATDLLAQADGESTALVDRSAYCLVLRSRLDTESVSVAELESAADRLLARWTHTPARAGGSGHLLFGTRRLVLSELVRRAPNGMRALDYVLRFQAAGTLVRSLKAPVPTAEEVLERLTRSEGAAWVWIAGRDMTHLLHLANGSVTVRRVAKPRRITQLRRAWEREIRSGSTGGTSWRSKGLEVAEALGGKRLFATRPTGVVHYVDVGLQLPSLELLPSYGAEGELLADQVALCDLQSLALTKWLDRPAAPRKRSPSLLVLASPKIHPETSATWAKAVQFDITAAERTQFSGGLPKEQVIWRQGKDATIEALQSPAALRASAWNIVCHGIRDGARERPAGLLLAASAAGNGELWCVDVDRLKAPGLVVLTACLTATGPVRSGDDIASDLGGAFLRAGAKTVLLSGRPVEVAAAAEFEAEWLARIYGGSSPAIAYRDARRSLRKKGKASRELDRSFKLIGLGDRPLFSPK